MLDNLANNFEELQTHLLIRYMGAYIQYIHQQLHY